MSIVQISERCATIVWIQCCIERSQSFKNVSFEEVSKKPDADLDVDGRSGAVIN